MFQKVALPVLFLVVGFVFALSVRVPVTRFAKEATLDLKQIWHSVVGVPTTRYTWTQADLDSTVSIDSRAELLALRESVQRLVFGESLAQESNDLLVEKSIVDPRYTDMAGLERIDQLTVKLDFGLESRVYHFLPDVPTGQTVVYHQGHAGDFYKGVSVIEALVEKGISVAAFSMPLMGVNQGLDIEHAKSGRLRVQTHDHLSLFKPEKGSTLRLFLQPVRVVLDYLQSAGESEFAMIGISGGAWTTALYAALDPRVTLSVPVAGSLPMRYKFAHKNSLGDYESREPNLAAMISYPEIYLLGAFGKSRRQVQVSNYYDPCCYSGDAPLEYQGVLSGKLKSLGPGRFDVFIDYSHTKHGISASVVDLFLRLLQNRQANL